MPLKLGRRLGTLGLGLLVAGPLAAIAWTGLPRTWRGPYVPLVVGLLSIALVAALRGAGHDRTHEGGSPGDRIGR